MKELQQYETLIHNENAEKIEYSISANYVKNLDAVFGIKEFIANFYDVNKREFLMKHSKKALLLEDGNTGIDIRYMIIGNSGSRESSDKIGEHGEGFKVGALTLVRLGHKVLIETVGYTIAFGIEKSSFLQTEVMFARYVKNKRKKGTKLFAECTASTFQKAKAMFLHLSDFQEITPNIIEMDTKMKNIYLNGLSHTTKNALFGYNIFEKNLVSNRDRNFIAFSVLKQQLLAIYDDLYDEKAISTVMHKMMAHPTTFHSLLEAKLIDELSLSKEQKAMYRKALHPTHYYMRKGSRLSVTDTKKEIIEVDERLFAFLRYIGAKVIENGMVVDKKDGVLHAYSVDQSLLPPTNEVEISTMHLIDHRIDIQENTVIVTPYRRTYENPLFPPKELFDLFILEHKATTKIPQKSYYSDFKTLWNHLILLACYDFQISVLYGGSIYTLEKEGVDTRLTIYVYKQPSKTDESYIHITKDCGFKQQVKEEEIQYIYAGCLKYIRIESLYSYQITNKKRSELHHYPNLVTQVIEQQLQQKTKTFIGGYLGRIKENLYEHQSAFDIKKSEKKMFQEVFNKIYPQHAIATNEMHNDLVKNQLGYRLLHPPNGISKTVLIEKAGIPDATSIFMEKQQEELIILPSTEPLKEAIELFMEMTGEEAVVHLTPLLPNKRESTNRNGHIYISQETPNVPVYLASLIAYEHCQVTKGLSKVTHEMQSHLTHYILG